MTREEAIKTLESLDISLLSAKNEISEIIKLLKSLKLLESPWISVEDDLPCNHKELVNDFIYATNDILALVNYEGVLRFEVCRMYKKYDTWKWYTNAREVLYWMPIIELSKEQKVKS